MSHGDCKGLVRIWAVYSYSATTLRGLPNTPDMFIKSEKRRDVYWVSSMFYKFFTYASSIFFKSGVLSYDTLWLLPAREVIVIERILNY